MKPAGEPAVDRVIEPTTTTTPGAVPGGMQSRQRVSTVTVTAWSPADKIVSFRDVHGLVYSRRLFASVLEYFLGLYATLNSFSQLSLRTRQRKEVVLVSTLHERRTERTGMGSWSRTKWLVVLGIAAAVIVGIVLIVMLTGGGGGSSGGGGY